MSSSMPDVFLQWFAQKQWQLRDYQAHMLGAFTRRESTLLIAPTGAGKTLSGFLPTLVDFLQQLAGCILDNLLVGLNRTK